MGARMSQAAPVGDASIPAASATGAFIAAFCRGPLSSGVMIGARDGNRGTMSGQPHSGSVVACDSACSDLHPLRAGADAMHHKKPVPLLLVDAPPRRLCPVCGSVSYSRDGIHPQCAERRADAPRMERVMADMKADERKRKAENSLLVRPWHKRCPRCQSQLHLREMTCVCGYQFDETR